MKHTTESSTSVDIGQRIKENRATISALFEDRKIKADECHTMLESSGTWDAKQVREYEEKMRVIDLKDRNITGIKHQLEMDELMVRAESMTQKNYSSPRTFSEHVISGYQALGSLLKLASGVGGAEAKAIRGELFDRGLITTESGHCQFSIYNALTKDGTGSGNTSAAASINTEIHPYVTHSLLSYGGPRQFGEVINSENGKDYVFPGQDTTTVKATIDGEDVTSTTVADKSPAALTSRTLKTHTVNSHPFPVSRESLMDSEVMLGMVVIREAVGSVYRAINQVFTVGTTVTNASDIDGIVPLSALGATSTISTGGTTNFQWQDLVTLMDSVDVAYLEGMESDEMMANVASTVPGFSPGKVAFMMHQSTFALVRELRDTYNRPIFAPDLQSMVSKMIYGYPVIINNNMPKAAAGAKIIVFGNGNYYAIRDVMAGSYLAFYDDSTYGRKNQVAWQYFLRTGGKVKGATSTSASVTTCQAFKHLATKAS